MGWRWCGRGAGLFLGICVAGLVAAAKVLILLKLNAYSAISVLLNGTGILSYLFEFVVWGLFLKSVV